MSAQHPPVNPIVVGLRVGLQVLFLSLVAFVVVMAFVSDTESTFAIVVVAAIMLLTYGAALPRTCDRRPAPPQGPAVDVGGSAHDRVGRAL